MTTKSIFRVTICAVLVVCGCSATPTTDSDHQSTASNWEPSQNVAAKPVSQCAECDANYAKWWSDGVEWCMCDMTADSDFDWLKANGFSAIAFTNHCVSKSASGDTVEGESLPVGDGRWLECVTAVPVARNTLSQRKSDGSEWCVLGQLASHSLGGDPRLTISATATPQNGPWTLEGRSNIAITIKMVASFAGAMTWPLWVNAQYSFAEAKPLTPGVSCDELFGL